VMATNSFVGGGGTNNASSLLSPINTTNVSLPRVGTSYSYASFRFFRGGTTSLLQANNTNPWCVTLVNSTDLLGSGATNLPANFTTIVIDPYNGSIRPFRPTL